MLEMCQARLLGLLLKMQMGRYHRHIEALKTRRILMLYIVNFSEVYSFNIETVIIGFPSVLKKKDI